MLNTSPFKNQKGSSLAKADFFYVIPEIMTDVLDRCPDDDWRLIFGLTRYCGMRCPSEVLTLQWSDILWAENKIRIDSPKTGLRFCALFPEIRPILEVAFDSAPEGQRFCVQRYRYDRETGRGYNPGTTAKRIIESAGHVPWEQPFIAMRKTRRNELELTGHRSTAIDASLGHDDKTAKKHYSRVTEADYQRGSQMLTTTSGGNAGGNTQASLGGHESPNEKRKRLKPSENATVASNVSFGVTPTGLEETPETSGNRVTTVAGGGAGGVTSSDTSASASLSEITSSWQRLTSQQRATILQLIHTFKNTPPSTDNTCTQ